MTSSTNEGGETEEDQEESSSSGDVEEEDEKTKNDEESNTSRAMLAALLDEEQLEEGNERVVGCVTSESEQIVNQQQLNDGDKVNEEAMAATAVDSSCLKEEGCLVDVSEKTEDGMGESEPVVDIGVKKVRYHSYY